MKKKLKSRLKNRLLLKNKSGGDILVVVRVINKLQVLCQNIYYYNLFYINFDFNIPICSGNNISFASKNFFGLFFL